MAGLLCPPNTQIVKFLLIYIFQFGQMQNAIWENALQENTICNLVKIHLQVITRKLMRLSQQTHSLLMFCSYTNTFCDLHGDTHGDYGTLFLLRPGLPLKKGSYQDVPFFCTVAGTVHIHPLLFHVTSNGSSFLPQYQSFYLSWHCKQ